MERVKIIDNMEKAIIKSFPNKKSNLQLRIIAKKTNELLHGRSNSETIGKRVAKMEKKNQYLIKTSKGIYALNPNYDFDIEDGEPLPLETKSIGIPIKQRENHTLELREAIENWIQHFPNPPHLENTYQENVYRGFLTSVKKCEDHLLFPDLLDHLHASGFDISDKWENYKSKVKGLEISENHLMKMIELNISKIFDKLSIRFVKNFDPLREDYQCSIPLLVFGFAFEEYTLEIRYSNAVRKARNDEEAHEIYCDLSSSLSNHVLLNFSPLFEKGDSIIWGDLPGPQLLRIPRKDKDILVQGMDRALAFIDNPPPEIKKGISEIADKLKLLDQEKENMLKELKSSLYCQCFSGDCRYLGGKSS